MSDKSLPKNVCVQKTKTVRHHFAPVLERKRIFNKKINSALDNLGYHTSVNISLE